MIANRPIATQNTPMSAEKIDSGETPELLAAIDEADASTEQDDIPIEEVLKRMRSALGRGQSELKEKSAAEWLETLRGPSD